VGPDGVPAQQAVLVLGEPGQGQVQDAFFGPAGFGGNGEDLGG
jgi:hypothetical protein